MISSQDAVSPRPRPCCSPSSPAASFIYAGRLPGPAIEIAKPAKYVGQTSTGRGDGDRAGRARVERSRSSSSRTASRRRSSRSTAPESAEIKQDGADRVRITRTFSRDELPRPQERAGAHPRHRRAARAARDAQDESTASHDVQVRLEKPTIAVLSTKHYVNLGGSEMVVYRATPPDVESGVQVGDLDYPGYPASGAKSKA